MQEAFIHLPLTDNNGQSLQTELGMAEIALLRAFGGLSCVVVKGLWRDPKTGQVYEDQCNRYAIAGAWDTAEENVLLDIAKTYAAIMRQECVYVAFPHSVHFVEP